MPPESSNTPTARIEQILTDLVLATKRAETLRKKLLAFGYRGNGAITNAGAVANTWYTFRNDANTADLSVPFTSSGGLVLIEVVATVWGSTQGYRDVAPVVDGVRLPELACSYLASGVAPGVMRFPAALAPGDHTMIVQVRSSGNTILDYRAVSIEVYEVVSG